MSATTLYNSQTIQELTNPMRFPTTNSTGDRPNFRTSHSGRSFGSMRQPSCEFEKKEGVDSTRSDPCGRPSARVVVREIFDRGGNLSNEFLGTRSGGAREFYEVNHRHQFPHPCQR